MKDTSQNKELLLVLLLMVGILTVVGAEYWYDSGRPVSIGEGQTVLVTVKPEMTAKDIGEKLYQNGSIHSVAIFRILAKVQGVENLLQAGDYAISSQISTLSIINKMAKGETVYRLLTIPEGYTVEEISKLLKEKGMGNGTSFKELARKFAPFDYMGRQSDIVYFAEGYLFPDTYRISRDMTEATILEMMVKNFDKRFTLEMRERAKSLGLSLQQIVTLASLVEKEAKLDQERAVIAGVFFNRLKLGIPLQSCPTVQYILGYTKTDLTIADTQIASPYNTYQNSGLPPGPIANPGLAALQAVLYPKDTPYLYFVATKDGSHRFSKTYADHLAAVEEVNKL